MTNTHTRWILPLSFFLLISYIIFLANTSNLNFGLEVVRVIPYGDKVMHTLLYGVMALLLNYGLEYRTFHKMQLGAIIVLLFATIEESSQYFIATRTFDLGDLLADFIGVIIFSLVRIIR